MNYMLNNILSNEPITKDNYIFSKIEAESIIINNYFNKLLKVEDYSKKAQNRLTIFDLAEEA